MRYQDLANATRHGPDPVAMRGPFLTREAFPDVLVAKAYSHDGEGLGMVFYPGKANGVFEAGFERLVPRGEYVVCGERIRAG